jgi:hypothetical protein
MIRPWAPDRMNSCMAWRLRHTVMVQNSVGPATRLAECTKPAVRVSWRRTCQDASSIAGKNRAPRSLERVVTASSSPARFCAPTCPHPLPTVGSSARPCLA